MSKTKSSISEKIIHTITEDDIKHYGIIIEPSIKTESAVLWVHGFFQSFYTEPAVSIGRQIATRGLSFISGNNRGHDFGALLEKINGKPQVGGSGWEKFDDSLTDIDSWINFIYSTTLINNIFLLGHSFGTRKVVYHQYKRKEPLVKGIILLSAETHYPKADEQTYNQAEKMITDHNEKNIVFWPENGCGLSAETYVERFNPQSIMRKLYSESPRPPIAEISVPILAITGSNEPDSNNKFKNLNNIGLNAVSSAHFTRHLLEGANHFYTGKEEDVANFIVNWILSIK